METIRSMYDGHSQGARKLLAETPAPSPRESGETICRDSTTGAVVNCQNPHAFIIIAAGMICIMFLVTTALVLLFWSIVKQRRREQRLGIVQTYQLPVRQSVSEIDQSATVNPTECDDFVFVLHSGDERPRFLAIRKLIPSDAGIDDDKGIADSGGNDRSEEERSYQVTTSGRN